MDLRPYNLSEAQAALAVKFAKRQEFRYQPWLLSESLEVGEGYNIATGWKHGLHGATAAAFDLGIGPAQTTDRSEFRRHNVSFRAFYEHHADALAARLDLPSLSFAEIGCNSGMNLFALACRGARRLHGYDHSDFTETIRWLNGILGAEVLFQVASWSAISHHLRPVQAADADVLVSSVFMNHQFDALQHLAYICDRARVAVFLWVLTAPDNPAAPMYVSYSKPGRFGDSGFPLVLDNEVAISEPMLRLSLEQLGFSDVEAIPPPKLPPEWENFAARHRAFLARRTAPKRSALL